MRSWEGTRLRDTPENRRLVEAQALIINAEMKAGTFDYLRQFPTGNKAPAVVETEQAAAKPPQTIGEYYRFGSSGKNRPSFARAWRAIIATTSRATFSQSSKRHHGLNSRRRCSTPSARTCSARKILLSRAAATSSTRVFAPVIETPGKSIVSRSSRGTILSPISVGRGRGRKIQIRSLRMSGTRFSIISKRRFRITILSCLRSF